MVGQMQGGSRGSDAVAAIVAEARRWSVEHAPGPACRGCEGHGCVVAVHPATRLELARDVGWPTVDSVPGRPRQLAVVGVRVVMDAMVPVGDAIAGPCMECDRAVIAARVRAEGGR